MIIFDGIIVYDFIDKLNIKDVKMIGMIGDFVVRGLYVKINFIEMLGKKLKVKMINFVRGGVIMVIVLIGKEVVENSIYR